MNSRRLAAWTCTALLAAAAPFNASAQAAKPDRIMSREELRACLLMRQKADNEAARIKERQKAFVADRDALNAEKAAATKASEEFLARGKQLSGENDALLAAETGLVEKAKTANTGEEQASLLKQRDDLVQRRSKLVKDVEDYKAAGAAQHERTVALNVRIEQINARSKTVNDGIDEALDLMDDWQAKCASRRYVADDDAELRKELGMPPK